MLKHTPLFQRTKLLPCGQDMPVLGRHLLHPNRSQVYDVFLELWPQPLWDSSSLTELSEASSTHAR